MQKIEQVLMENNTLALFIWNRDYKYLTLTKDSALSSETEALHTDQRLH